MTVWVLASVTCQRALHEPVVRQSEYEVAMHVDIIERTKVKIAKFLKFLCDQCDNHNIVCDVRIDIVCRDIRKGLESSVGD